MTSASPALFSIQVFISQSNWVDKFWQKVHAFKSLNQIESYHSKWIKIVLDWNRQPWIVIWIVTMNRYTPTIFIRQAVLSLFCVLPVVQSHLQSGLCWLMALPTSLKPTLTTNCSRSIQSWVVAQSNHDVQRLPDVVWTVRGVWFDSHFSFTQTVPCTFVPRLPADRPTTLVFPNRRIDNCCHSSLITSFQLLDPVIEG